MRESVELFAKQMEKRLEENDHKTGWIDCSNEFLTDSLYHNFKELIVYLRRGDSIKAVEATTDIANYAMMIADKTKKGASDVNGYAISK